MCLSIYATVCQSLGMASCPGLQCMHWFHRQQPLKADLSETSKIALSALSLLCVVQATQMMAL